MKLYSILACGLFFLVSSLYAASPCDVPGKPGELAPMADNILDALQSQTGEEKVTLEQMTDLFNDRICPHIFEPKKCPALTEQIKNCIQERQKVREGEMLTQ